MEVHSGLHEAFFATNDSLMKLQSHWTQNLQDNLDYNAYKLPHINNITHLSFCEIFTAASGLL